MCGIAGLWNFDGRPVSPVAFDRFVDALAHRGPDGRGVYIDEARRLALGHRLLSIQSTPSLGLQPMQLGGRYWITFNGEVFNFLELRAELELLGHVFRSGTDSEVVLAAYAQWGEACLERFNGMWAFSVWDAQAQELFLAVDRVAVKSAVYIARPQYFAFASEIKAFARLDRYRFEPDPAEAVRLLSTSVEAFSKTWVRDVMRLPAGHSLKVDRGGRVTLRRWWTPVADTSVQGLSRSQQAQRLRDLLESAVAMRLNGRSSIVVPVSGGMDSSAVLGVAADLQRRPGATTVGGIFVRKRGDFDEELHATAAAGHCKVPLKVIDHPDHYTVDSMLNVVQTYETLAFGSDGPLRMYRSIKQSGASVSLDGHGGDELFGGYEPYLVAAMQDACSGVPRLPKLLDLVRILRGMSPTSDHYRLHEGWREPAALAWKTLSDRLRPGPDGRVLGIRAQRHMHKGDAPTLPEFSGELDKALYIDIHFGFLQRVLRSFDYASMASGVEARTPFLDWRVVSFALGLAGERKIERGYTKRILRDAMAGLLPESVRWRRSKVGFIDKSAYFFSPEIKAWMADMFASQSLRENKLWNGQKMVDMHARWQRGEEGGVRLSKQLLNVAVTQHLITHWGNESLAAARETDHLPLASAA